MENKQEASAKTESLFSSLYKNNYKNLELSQQQRRENFLEEQKRKRHQITDQHRELCEMLIKEIDTQEEMECDPIKQKQLKFELMCSEWFTDVPDDLEDNWLVKICPQGFRILLIARNHITICYNKRGRIILKIKSNFPGGHSQSNGITVLDCIFNKFTNSIFILDCLFWNSMSMLESEATFRFFWLKTKFEENPSFIEHDKYNFTLLDYKPAQRPLIQDEMFKVLPVKNGTLSFDGVVFYHKESHYTFGSTPLVGWLASYMLPEKLHIDVGPENLVNKPKDYICIKEYLQNRENIKKKKRDKKHETEVDLEMEIQ